MGHLTGRCAIITGAAYGIGFAAAERLAMEGARVVIADIKGHEAAAERLSGKGLNAIAMEADVTDVGSVSALVREIMSQYGRVDILVNNAAISAELRPAPFEQSSPEEWRRIYEVNVIGVFNMCKAVSPHMRAAKAGRIVNVSSGTALKGTPGMLHYIASKGAIISMTRSLASEFSADQITVNAVSPGFTVTESVQAAPELLKNLLRCCDQDEAAEAPGRRYRRRKRDPLSGE
jgi:NAD(P)-dependent dehydrogenase (short-subunit alcohol dehydrogenase family)